MLLWDQSVEVTIRSYSLGHIDCEVEAEGAKWQFTGFYGNPVTEDRRFSWLLLKRLAELRKGSELSWVVGGDFNEILQDSEKQGGRARSLSQMNAFREAVFDCGLFEIAHPDTSFTWFNKRGGGEIFERLDRFLGDRWWQDRFPNAKSTTLDFFGSDHRPILCKLEGDDEKVTCFGKGRFHFEDKW